MHILSWLRFLLTLTLEERKKKKFLRQARAMFVFPLSNIVFFHQIQCLNAEKWQEQEVLTGWIFTVTVVPARPLSFCAAASLPTPSSVSPVFVLQQSTKTQVNRYHWKQFSPKNKNNLQYMRHLSVSGS